MRFDNSRRNQAKKLVRDKDAIANIINISDDVDNCLLFKYNVKYK